MRFSSEGHDDKMKLLVIGEKETRYGYTEYLMGVCRNESGARHDGNACSGKSGRAEIDVCGVEIFALSVTGKSVG